MQVTALARYPVKSCRGEALQIARVRPWGLDGDRRWMLVDSGGAVITGRAHPSLVLVRTQSDGAAMRLSAPGRASVTIAEPTGREQVQVRIWDDEVAAAPAPPDVDAWFSDYLGLPARLVYLDDPTRRRVDPRYGRETDVVSFADAYPLLLTSVQSLDALNDLVWTGPWPYEAPLSMTRFRPSVVVGGAPAWVEDDWKRIRIGGVQFRVAKGCDRCVFTTIDPDTGEKGREPLVTLARHRRWDGKIWFGLNLIPDLDLDAPPPTLQLGDPVDVID
jgi:hypothetical protein